jgi:heat shock protein HslJ
MKKSESSELLVQFLIVAGFVALLAIVSLVQAKVSPASGGTPSGTSEATKTPDTTATTDQATVVKTTDPSKTTGTPAPSPTLVVTQPFTPTITEAPTSTVKPTSTRAPTNTPVPQPTLAPTSTANPEATNPPTNPTNPIVDIVWQWISVTNKSNWQTTEIQNPENYTITFRADGSLIGRADCNIFSGVYSQLAGFTIELGPMTMTYCGEGSQDRQFLQLLNDVAAGGPDGQGNLALETAGGEQRMEFENGGTQ